MKIGWSYYYW